MAKKAEGKQRSVYLLKPACAIRDVVDAIGLGHQSALSVAVDGASEATFVALRSVERPAAWIDFFSDQDSEEIQAALQKQRTQSASGLLLVRFEKAVFVITFGYGHTLLDDAHIDETFGLRVALNSIDPKSLKSLDRSNVEVRGHRIREQTPASTSLDDFSIDFDRDLVQAVAGIPTDRSLGKTVAGFDSLSVRLPNESSKIGSALLRLLELSAKDDYLTSFPGIDNIRAVKATPTIDSLEARLIEALRTRAIDKVWLAPPEINNPYSPGRYRYTGFRCKDEFDDIYIEEFLDAVPKLDKISSASLVSWKVHQLGPDGNTEKSWSLFRCIHAEFEVDKNTYILNAGKWYVVKSDFVERVNDVIGPLLSKAAESACLPDYDHSCEADYNQYVGEAVAEAKVLDRRLIHGYGSPHSKIEVCDLLIRDRLIHVKRYSSSAALSHLFKQASVAAELLCDASFRKLVNKAHPTTQFPEEDDFQRSQYVVCVAIVAKSVTPLNLPFFSRVALKNTLSYLRKIGYRVEVSAIKDVYAYGVKRRRTPARLDLSSDWPLEQLR
ncbi:MAG: DUF6119 family protein [Moraxellaceae bacterium]|nr:DUF6119 family protein [Moraxellaceae bacterium]